MSINPPNHSTPSVFIAVVILMFNINAAQQKAATKSVSNYLCNEEFSHCFLLGCLDRCQAVNDDSRIHLEKHYFAIVENK